MGRASDEISPLLQGHGNRALRDGQCIVILGIGAPAWSKREFEEGNFEAFDELSHEIEVEGIDRVARKVIVRIAEEGCQ